MRITVDGVAGSGVAAKDIVLAIIAHVGADGAPATPSNSPFGDPGIVDRRAADAVQYVDRGRRALRHGRAGREDLCLSQRPAYRRRARNSIRAVEEWSSLTTDREAQFDRDVTLDAKDIAPTVTWAPVPRTRCRSTPACPIPRANPTRRARAISRRARIHGHRARSKATDIAVDRVFIGSCTNSRIEICGRRRRPGWPDQQGAGPSFRGLFADQASGEEEGSIASSSTPGSNGRIRLLDCVGINGDLVASGERCASTTNRNFRPAGSGRADASDVAGHGSRRRRSTATWRGAPLSRRKRTLTSGDQVHQLTAAACPINQSNLNTDQILPARYLKWTRAMGRQGAVPGPPLRRRGQGESRTSRSTTGLRNARIVVGGRNFGCARRARPPSMRSMTTVRVVIAPSFGDIFSGNAIQNGWLAMVTDDEAAEIMAALQRTPSCR